MSESTHQMPTPLIAPMGLKMTRPMVQEVWDTFVKPDQDSGIPQSAEMRGLMAILRAVYQALPEESSDG